MRTAWCSRSASSRPTALNTPGAGGTSTDPDPEARRHLGREQGSVAAERHDRELARVAAAFHGHRPDGTGHARLADQERAVRGVVEVERERRSHLLGDGSPRQLAVEAQAARQSLVVEVAQHDVRVRERRVRAALRVAGGPRDRARAARPDVELAGVVDADDAAAAGADLGDVDRRARAAGSPIPC